MHLIITKTTLRSLLGHISCGIDKNLATCLVALLGLYAIVWKITFYSCDFNPLVIYLAAAQITQLLRDSCACSLLLRKQLAVFCS